MPEPIRETKIVEPASPLEYRSGKKDYDELGPYWQVDGPRVRAALTLLGIPIGFGIASLISFILLFISRPAGESSFGFLTITHAVGLALECFFFRQVGVLRATRTTTVIRGMLLGMMIIPLMLILVAAYQWFEGLQ